MAVAWPNSNKINLSPFVTLSVALCHSTQSIAHGDYNSVVIPHEVSGGGGGSGNWGHSYKKQHMFTALEQMNEKQKEQNLHITNRLEEDVIKKKMRGRVTAD